MSEALKKIRGRVLRKYGGLTLVSCSWPKAGHESSLTKFRVVPVTDVHEPEPWSL
jgi:hypothetical protein